MAIRKEESPQKAATREFKDRYVFTDYFKKEHYGQKPQKGLCPW